jgi:hypothetical protein
MKRAYILCLLTVCSMITFGQSARRNTIVLGLDMYDTDLDIYGVKLESYEGRGGIFLNGGYEIFPLKEDWQSIEPRIGVGCFSNSGKSEDSVPDHKYYMFAFSFGVAPKYNIATNGDDTAFLFIENDFMFYNALARIQDKGMNEKRVVCTYLNFYYAFKLGLKAKTKNNVWFGAFVGLSSMDFTNTLNTNLPKGVESYGKELCFFNLGLQFGF